MRCSDRTRRKIANKHGLTIEEIHAAVVGVRGLTAVWDRHPQRGLRLIVRTWLRSRRALVVLYPVGRAVDGVFDLGSAYFIDQ